MINIEDTDIKVSVKPEVLEELEKLYALQEENKKKQKEKE